MAIALLVAYDGTDYHGYQRQPVDHGPTIQGTLEATLARVHGVPVATMAAGRTDAGVHASGQVVIFQAQRPARFTPADWQRALNALLPTNIAVRAAAEVADTVHARFTATERIYRYQVLQDLSRDPLRERYAWRVPTVLNLTILRAACEALRGVHDFAAFGQNPDDQPGQPRGTTVRDLRVARAWREGDVVWFEVAANAFLTGMVRRLVSTWVLAGLGKISVEDVTAILAARQLNHKGTLAPACGLCLSRVRYPSGTITWPANHTENEDPL